ncbi:MAG: HipA family kinase [Myxococcota bacterium]
MLTRASATVEPSRLTLAPRIARRNRCHRAPGGAASAGLEGARSAVAERPRPTGRARKTRAGAGPEGWDRDARRTCERATIPSVTTDRPTLVRFIERTTEGMQRPPIFEASDGHRYVLKLDTADADFPIAELVAAELAVALDVRLPAFEILDAPEPLVEAFIASGDRDHREFAESFRRRGHSCFGSRFLDGIVVKWAERQRAIVGGAAEFLVNLLVFDGFVENGDRTSATNPNLLVANGTLFAIDHGQALPCVAGLRSRLPFPFDSHLGWTTLVEDLSLLDEPLARLRGLADTRIDAAVARVPKEWWGAPERPDMARAALRERRDALPAILEGVRERLR